jgi:membrane protein implicated in regulation of membrane protease activity
VDWLGDHLWGLWLLVAVALGVAEMVSLNLILLMMAVGALLAALVAVAGAPFVLQLLVAAAGSAAMLAFVRPSLIARLHSGPDLVSGHNKLVGQQGVVTEELAGTEPGRVKVGGEIWSARPYDDSLVIPPGTHVEVFEIRGATAYVHPVGELMP